MNLDSMPAVQDFVQFRTLCSMIPMKKVQKTRPSHAWGVICNFLLPAICSGGPWPHKDREPESKVSATVLAAVGDIATHAPTNLQRIPLRSTIFEPQQPAPNPHRQLPKRGERGCGAPGRKEVTGQSAAPKSVDCPGRRTRATAVQTAAC